MDFPALIHQLRVIEWDYAYTLWKIKLFGFQWWFITIIVASAYIIWWKMTDKTRLSRLLLFGSFVAVMRVIFDDIVVGMGWYSYPIRIIPLPRSLFANDLIIIPLAYMLIYQYTSSWKGFLLWSAIGSGVWSFAVKPLFATLSILVIYGWKYYYSFIAVLLIGLLSRLAFLFVMKVEKKYSALHSDDLNKNILKPAMKPMKNKKDDEDQ